MEELILPQFDWYVLQFKTLKEFEKTLEDKLKGHTVEIQYLDCANGHRWKQKQIVVKKVEYHGNRKGYVDVDGPTLFDEEGQGYHTHSDFGIRIIK